MDITTDFQEIFFTFIKEQTQEYVEKGIITENQRQQIINYHKDNIKRDQEFRKGNFD